MATTLLHKRSSTAGDVPLVSDLQLGELAVNTAQGHVYLKVDDGVSSPTIHRLRGEPLSDVGITLDTFSGDDSTTDFTLTKTPEDEQYLIVSINGVIQHTSSYSLNNVTLSFNTAPATGDAIEARTINITASSVSARDYKSYVYEISSSTTTISGTDDNGNTLLYDIDLLQVFYNGVKLVPGNDYTANNGTSITLNDTIEDGHIEVISLAKAVLTDQDPLKPVSATLTGTNQQTVDSFLYTNYRTVKYLVQMTRGTDYHSTEVIVIHDDTDVSISEYGTIYTNGSLGTISADINGNYVRLLVTPSASSTTVVKGQRLTVTV